MTLPVLAQKVPRKITRLLSAQANDIWVQGYLRRAGVARAPKIPSFTTKPELQALFTLAFEAPAGSVALEIGSYIGASTCYIAAGLAAGKGHLFCVDTWNNETMPDGVRDTFAEFGRNTRGVRRLVTARRKSSHDLVPDDLRLPLHLAFLDGDHSYEAIKGDFEMVGPWMAEDGVVAFHDCLYYEGVSRVIGEALASGIWVMAGQVGNLFWMKRANFPYR